jgi:hypothetical protein
MFFTINRSEEDPNDVPRKYADTQVEPKFHPIPPFASKLARYRHVLRSRWEDQPTNQTDIFSY